MRCRHAPILDCGNYRSLYLLSCKVGAMISTGTEQKFTGVSKLRTRSSLVRSLQHCYLLQHSTSQTCIITSKHSVCHQAEWLEAVLSDSLPSEPNRCHWARPGPGIFWQHLVSCWGEAKFAGSLGSRPHKFAPEIFHLFASYCHFNELGKICKRLGSVFRTSGLIVRFIFSL